MTLHSKASVSQTRSVVFAIIDIGNEITARAGQNDDLVCSILRNAERGIDKFRMCLCGHRARAVVGVQLNRKYTAAGTC